MRWRPGSDGREPRERRKWLEINGVPSRVRFRMFIRNRLWIGLPPAFVAGFGVVLLLLVSGGHCQILAVKGVGDYERLGTTIDDATGEAFDKVAKMLGLGYPGGPMIEKMAEIGDENRFVLPHPLKNISMRAVRISSR